YRNVTGVQTCALPILLTHFVTKQNQMKFVHLKIDFSLLGQIFSIGFPSFIVQGAAAVMVIAFNIAFSHFVGEKGIIAYAVVNNMYTVFLMMFTGIGAAL